MARTLTPADYRTQAEHWAQVAFDMDRLFGDNPSTPYYLAMAMWFLDMAEQE